MLYRSLVPELKTVVEVIPVATRRPELAGTSVRVQAVWDTGATRTVISNSLQNQLGLFPVRKVMAMGVNSIIQADMTEISIRLTDGIIMPNIEVVVSELNSGSCQILIGMDIISLGDFSISNANGETVFSFVVPPFQDRVDLFDKANEANRKNAP
jgi:large-conductance mechanosensitive channel